MNYRFAQPEFLWGLIPLALYTLFLVWRFHRTPEWFSWRRSFLTVIAFLLCIIGLARPQGGSLSGKPEPITANVFLALDISNSMLAEDITPNRLSFSVLFIQKVMDQMVKPRLALFPFAASGFLQLPLTTDTYAIYDSLLSLDPTATSHQGTDFNETLSDLMKTIRQMENQSADKLEEWTSPRVVIISDGESQIPFRSESLKPFLERNIPIYTVGVGTPNGGQISVPKGFSQAEILKDPQSGLPAVTRMNSKTLEEISLKTGGAYFSGIFENVPLLAQQLNQSLSLGKRMTQFKVQSEFFPFFFLLAFLLFFWELCHGRWQYVLKTFLLLGLLTAGPASLAEDDQLKAIQAYNQGLQQLGFGNLEKAAELFEESALVLQDTTSKKKALFNLGNTFLKMGDPEQALESYQRAYRTRGKSPEFEEKANKDISDNMVLASQLMEQMQQQKRPGKDSEEGDQPSQKDPKGPQQFQGEVLNDQQKQKLYDLIGSEEKQTLKRIREKNNPPGPNGGRPW